MARVLELVREVGACAVGDNVRPARVVVKEFGHVVHLAVDDNLPRRRRRVSARLGKTRAPRTQQSASELCCATCSALNALSAMLATTTRDC